MLLLPRLTWLLPFPTAVAVTIVVAAAIVTASFAVDSAFNAAFNSTAVAPATVVATCVTAAATAAAAIFTTFAAAFPATSPAALSHAASAAVVALSAFTVALVIFEGAAAVAASIKAVPISPSFSHPLHIFPSLSLAPSPCAASCSLYFNFCLPCLLCPADSNAPNQFSTIAPQFGRQLVTAWPYFRYANITICLP